MGVLDDDELPPLHHDKTAWDLYHQELRWLAEGHENADKAAYIPPPDVVAWRAALVRWLRNKGFNEIFIESCMTWDNPRIETVVDMVQRYGVRETYRRCRPFLTGNAEGDPV